MSGCDWANKSFSVAVIDRTLSVCSKCKKEIENLYRYNGDVLCQECFSNIKPNRVFSVGNFGTDKDLAYNFTTDMFDGKPMQITSRRQYKTLLKQHKMIDASPKECFDHARFRKKIVAEDNIRNTRKISEKIFLKNKERLRFRKER